MWFSSLFVIGPPSDSFYDHYAYVVGPFWTGPLMLQSWMRKAPSMEDFGTRPTTTGRTGSSTLRTLYTASRSVTAWAPPRLFRCWRVWSSLDQTSTLALPLRSCLGNTLMATIVWLASSACMVDLTSNCLSIWSTMLICKLSFFFWSSAHISLGPNPYDKRSPLNFLSIHWISAIFHRHITHTAGTKNLQRFDKIWQSWKDVDKNQKSQKPYDRRLILISPTP